jgi:hypothetical protein
VHAHLDWSTVSYQKIFFFTKHFNKTLHSFCKLFSKSLHYSCSKSDQRKVAIIFRKWFFCNYYFYTKFKASYSLGTILNWLWSRKLFWSFRLCRKVHWYKKSFENFLKNPTRKINLRFFWITAFGKSATSEFLYTYIQMNS